MGFDGASFGMLLPFDREGPEDAPFCMGFECGRIWQRAKNTGERFSELVHVENAEMMLRIGEALGRVVRSDDLNEWWIEVTFEQAFLPYETGDPI
jgi:hypothetical protein